MADYKQEYVDRKNKLLTLLQQASAWMQQHDFKRESEVLQAWKEKLMTDQFSIALIGEFSAGKSTFLNALMHEKLLPSFSSETTATLTFLRHADKAQNGEAGHVFYNEGTEESIPTLDGDTIADYVCTASTKKDVAAQISHFDIFIKNKFLEENVTLVDTPGLNGLKEGHAKLTKEQIERSNASIYVFNATQPGKASDFKTLAELRSKVPQIFLVLNRIDSVSCNENETVEDIIRRLQESYMQEYPGETQPPVIYPVSAYQALVARSKTPLSYREKTTFSDDEKAKLEAASHMGEFEERLWKFLTLGEKGRQMLIGPSNMLKKKVQDVVDTIIDHIELLEQNPNEEQINKRIEQLQEAISKLESAAGSNESVVKEAVRSAEQEFIESIRAQAVQLRQKMFNKVSNISSLDEIEPDRIMREINREMNVILQDAYQDYARRIEQAMVECSGKVCAELPYSLFEELHIRLEQKLELTELDSGTDVFEQKILALQQQCDDLEDKIDSANMTVLEAKRLERKRIELQRQIEAEQDSKKWYLNNAQAAMPSTVRYVRHDVQEVARQGVLGKVGDFLLGPKQKVIEQHVVDSSDRDAYRAEMERQERQYNEEIARLREQKAQVEDADAEAAAMIVRQYEQALRRKNEEAACLQNEWKEKIEKEYKKQLRKQKGEIEDYIDSTKDEMIRMAQKEFEERKKAQVGALMTLITAPLREKIEQQKKECELLNKQKDDAEIVRKGELEKMQKAKEELGAILLQAMDLDEELQAIPVNAMEA